MDLAEHYDRLYQDAIQKIKSGEFQTDTLIDSLTDNRLGMTLILRPSDEVKENIQKFINELKIIDPHQYYYPNSDIHITVMSIISCYNGFRLSTVPLNDYVDTIIKSISGQKPFEIQLKGITASPSCILIQGFVNNESLNQIRDRLRINFKQTTLEQSIDQRYSIQTAHSTVIRFRKELTQRDDFISILDRYRDFNFGTFTIDSLELVCNDWYLRNEFVNQLYRFELASL